MLTVTVVIASFLVFSATSLFMKKKKDKDTEAAKLSPYTAPDYGIGVIVFVLYHVYSLVNSLGIRERQLIM